MKLMIRLTAAAANAPMLKSFLDIIKFLCDLSCTSLTVQATETLKIISMKTKSQPIN